MKDIKKVKIKGETYEVSKMPLRRSASLLMAIEGLPSKVQNLISSEELENLDNNTILSKAPLLLAKSQDEIINLVAVASGIDKEVLDEGGLDDFIDVLSAVLETNNVNLIIDKVKNLKTVFQK